MLPTGTGKTVVFAALARYLAEHLHQQITAAKQAAAAAEEAVIPLGRGSSSSNRGRPRRTAAAAAAAAAAAEEAKGLRVLVLAHRHELLRQAEEKFSLMWPGVTVSWVKGGRKEFYGQVGH
jgi:superfamily II DNA or RNA helicase